MTNDLLDTIVARGLIASESVAAEIREQVADIIENHRNYGQTVVIDLVRELLAELEPSIADAIADTELAGWIAGFQNTAKMLPKKLPPIVPALILPPTAFDDDRTPFVRFPKLEKAAASLLRRKVMTPEQFYTAGEVAKANGFTISGGITTDTIAIVQEILHEQLVEGPSFRDFREVVVDRLGKSPISASHLETVFRVNVQTAFAVGHESIASNEIIEELFPYQEYIATRDARVRPDHWAMESNGLNGTGIYRRDDPVWLDWTPPASWNCRCGVRLVDVEEAAAKGVMEAREWLRTGRPPVPTWRGPYIAPPVGAEGFVSGKKSAQLARAA